MIGHFASYLFIYILQSRSKLILKYSVTRLIMQSSSLMISYLRDVRSLLFSANIFEIPLITLNTLINCRDRSERRESSSSSSYLTSPALFFILPYHFVSQSGPFMIRLVPVLPQASLPRLCMSFAARTRDRTGW